MGKERATQPSWNVQTRSTFWVVHQPCCPWSVLHMHSASGHRLHCPVCELLCSCNQVLHAWLMVKVKDKRWWFFNDWRAWWLIWGVGCMVCGRDVSLLQRNNSSRNELVTEHSFHVTVSYIILQCKESELGCWAVALQVNFCVCLIAFVSYPDKKCCMVTLCWGKLNVALDVRWGF